MDRFYFAPMSCSLAVSILFRELGMKPDSVLVDLASKTLEDGSPYAAVNPKLQVPALQLEDGEVLTEVGALLQLIADKDDHQRFIAPLGTAQRRREVEWLSFLSGELHKGVFYVIFHPDASAEARSFARSLAPRPLDILSAQLARSEFLSGRYSVADMLLFVLLCWSEYAGVELMRWPVLTAYRKRLMKRDAARAAVSIERALLEAGR